MTLSTSTKGYYLTLAEAALPHLDGAEQGVWLARLGYEQANLRAALSWLWSSGDQERGLRLAETLYGMCKRSTICETAISRRC